MEYVYTISEFIIMVFLYSCIGWLMEVILKFIEYKRFINRGYLIGPYCPIYGVGVGIITITVNHFIRTGNCSEIFLIGMVICGIWEYFISWAMEKLFHARWWDYSQRPMNLNGRIWMGNLIAFGLGSVIICKWMNPKFLGWIEKCPNTVNFISAICIVIVVATDYFISIRLMGTIKEEIDAREEDNSEEISLKVREILKSKSLFIQRISDAYPKFQARPHRLMLQLKAAEKELRLAKQELKKAKQDLEAKQKELKEASKYFKEEVKNVAKNVKIDSDSILEDAKERFEKANEKLRDIKNRLHFH